MNRSDINLALRGKLGDKAEYLGCFAADEISDLDLSATNGKKILVFIVNILPTYKAKLMGHWISFAIFNTNKVYCFDSLGLNPDEYNNHIRLFLSKYKEQVFSNATIRMQGYESFLCGFFALTFTHLISRFGLPKTLKYLSNNLSSTNFHFNDFFVFSYCLKYLRLKSCASIWGKVRPWFSQIYCRRMRANNATQLKGTPL